MYNNLSQQAKDILENKLLLRKTLSQVLSNELLNYLMELLDKDEAHQKYLDLIKR